MSPTRSQPDVPARDDGAAVRRRLPAAVRRPLILEAALAEFAEHGYDGSSMGRIAGASDVGRTALYDHFASKRELFGALLAAKEGELIAHLRETIAADAPTEERMRATIDAVFAFAERDPDGWRLVFGEREPRDPELAAELSKGRRRTVRLLAAMIAPDAERAGIDPRSTLAQVVFVQQMAAIRAAVEWRLTHPRASREDLVDGTMAALWLGVSGLERSGPAGA